MTQGPILVAAVQGIDERLQGLQRIFLHPTEDRKRSAFAKMGCGVLKGGACRLSSDLSDGTLILTEGVETGLAVLAAFARGGPRPGVAVWAAISTSILRFIELPTDLVKRGGPISRIIIAGDHDRVDEHTGHRPGEHAAIASAERLRKLYPHIAIGIALPNHACAPALIGKDGEIAGKSVDWLDVYVQCGRDAVRDVLQGAVAAPSKPASATGSADGDEIPKDLQLGGNHLDRAWLFLRQMYSPPVLERGRGWGLRRWDAEWWRFDGSRWIILPEEGMRADALKWLNRFYEFRPARDGGGKWVPMNPTDKAVNAMLEALKTIVFVTAERMPCWLPEDVDDTGQVIFGERRPWQSSLTVAAAIDRGWSDPQLLIPCPNGLVDGRAWLDRKGVLLPHTELLFTGSCLPYDCPVDALERCADDDDALQDAIAEMCPLWLEYLASSMGDDEEAIEALAMFMGLSLTPDMSHEVIAVLSGPPGAGKSTCLEGFFSTIGMDNVVISDMNQIARPFHMHALIGRNLCAMTDSDVGRTTDAGISSESLKKISGGDPVFVDRKNRDALPQVRLYCKIIILCNRMPNLPDPSGALARRFRVFPFDESFTGNERREFKDQAVLLREAPGRLLWALRGLRLLHARGHIPQPKRGQELLAEYSAYADPLGTFRDECLELKEGSFEYTSALYATWVKWCTETGRPPRHDGWFGKELRAACPRLRRTQKERKWGYDGIRIRPEAMAHTSPEPVWGQPKPLPV